MFKLIRQYWANVILFSIPLFFAYIFYVSVTSTDPSSSIIGVVGVLLILSFVVSVFAHRIDFIGLLGSGSVGLNDGSNTEGEASSSNNDQSDVEDRIEAVKGELIGLIRDAEDSGDFMTGLEYQQHFSSDVQDIITSCEQKNLAVGNARRANEDVTTTDDVRNIIEQLNLLRRQLSQQSRAQSETTETGS